MAGHSHWAGIKHKKALIDNKRGKLWSKLSKAIIVAAKLGGGDPGANIRLRTAILDAKAASMPKDTIERAIKKGTGELDGGNFDEVLYEGYAAGGVAVLCDILTDNRNRTAPEIRKIFDVHNGKLGGTNCVAWMFERKGLFVVPAQNVAEDSLMEIALEAGADDVKPAGDNFEVTCDPDMYGAVGEALEQAGIALAGKEVTRIPKNTVELSADDARKVIRLLEALDDHDDVQNVSANFNVSDQVLAQVEAAGS
ncbi:MAG: YebC/PmpR family DNA-binding transcriptional regulator [Pirellulaceae bacterium]|jgi:YebC/PmpR family DNA-binding regulatory protein|nr:YebC/PmpR family DNA-binding transcriptional regulator [Pirellulaceae bacterium]